MLPYLKVGAGQSGYKGDGMLPNLKVGAGQSALLDGGALGLLEEAVAALRNMLAGQLALQVRTFSRQNYLSRYLCSCVQSDSLSLSL